MDGVEGVRRVARRVVQAKEDGDVLVVVVSGMNGERAKLTDLAASVSDHPSGRELDTLLTSSGRVAASLLALAISGLGLPARSFTGGQAGIVTDSCHNAARIVDVTPARVRAAVDEGVVAVVPGLQGVSRSTGDATTLGPGGADTTAVALAAALGADLCEIHGGVVCEAGPPEAGLRPAAGWVSFSELMDLAGSGRSRLARSSEEYALRHDVPILLRSDSPTDADTWVSRRRPLQVFTPSFEQEASSLPGVTGVLSPALGP
jgi:aspartate kinase